MSTSVVVIDGKRFFKIADEADDDEHCCKKCFFHQNDLDCPEGNGVIMCVEYDDNEGIVTDSYFELVGSDGE